MGKLPAFLFFPGDWLKDPALRACSHGTRGIWMDMLCAMFENGRSGEITGTLEGLARIAGCTVADLELAMAEIRANRCGIVRRCHGKVTLRNRRMHREAQERKGNYDRKIRERERKRASAVTPESRESHGTVPQKSRSLLSVSVSSSVSEPPNTHTQRARRNGVWVGSQVKTHDPEAEERRWHLWHAAFFPGEPPTTPSVVERECLQLYAQHALQQHPDLDPDTLFAQVIEAHKGSDWYEKSPKSARLLRVAMKSAEKVKDMVRDALYPPGEVTGADRLIRYLKAHQPVVSDEEARRRIAEGDAPRPTAVEPTQAATPDWLLDP